MVNDINPALPYGPVTMGIIELLWVMQGLYHQPYCFTDLDRSREAREPEAPTARDYSRFKLYGLGL